MHPRGGVITLSVQIFVCGHKNEHSEQSKSACELYLLATVMSQKYQLLYIPHDRVSFYKCREKQAF